MLTIFPVWNLANKLSAQKRIYFVAKKPEDCNVIEKEAPTQMLPYEFCKIVKNNYFEE